MCLKAEVFQDRLISCEDGSEGAFRGSNAVSSPNDLQSGIVRENHYGFSINLNNLPWFNPLECFQDGRYEWLNIVESVGSGA